MDIFYHAMNYTSKETMDAASRGESRRKSVEETTQLIEELENSNYRAPSEALGSSNRLRRGGEFELNKISTIEAKIDTIMNNMNNQEIRGQSCNKVGTMEGAEHKCVVDEGLAHEGPYHVKEA